MPSRAGRPPKVPPSQWDQAYGNGDGRLTNDERGVALMAETVFERHPVQVEIRTDAFVDPGSPFRAGGTYRDAAGGTQARIYPGAVGMSPWLVPFVTAHELGHVVHGHLDRGGPHDQSIELEADRFAGKALAWFEEDLELVIAELRAKSGDRDSHGQLDEVIAAVREGYAEGVQELKAAAQGQPDVPAAGSAPPVPSATAEAPAPASAAPGAPSPIPAPGAAARRPASISDALARVTDAFDAYLASSRGAPK